MERSLKRLTVVCVALLSTGISSAWAQTNDDYVVRFTGFLGDLRVSVGDLRAGLAENNDETSKVSVVLNEEAAAQYLLFTRTHVNQSVNMFICGQQVLTTTITEPVTSGSALSGEVDLDTATQMVDALNGLGECPG